MYLYCIVFYYQSGLIDFNEYSPHALTHTHTHTLTHTHTRTLTQQMFGEPLSTDSEDFFSQVAKFVSQFKRIHLELYPPPKPTPRYSIRSCMPSFKAVYATLIIIYVLLPTVVCFVLVESYSLSIRGFPCI